MNTPYRFVDTHTHLYAKEFDKDSKKMIQRALDAQVEVLLLPNIDLDSITILHKLCETYPKHCFPMMGLHPCSVKPDTYLKALTLIEQYLFESSFQYCGVGEIGLDLHWDPSTLAIQQEALRKQLQWAKKLNLAVSVHTRAALDETLDLIESEQDGTLKGVIHCFGGTLEQAQRVIHAGFSMGIGGVVTFKKNERLREVVSQVDLKHFVLETDAPYLAPEPYRGKRNESSYIPIIAHTIAEAQGCNTLEVAQKTTENALALFPINEVV